MRTIHPIGVLLAALLLVTPLGAKERTGVLAPPEVKKEQDQIMRMLIAGNKKHMKHIVRKNGLARIMIVSCADSRIPPETVFNVKPGEIFTNRAFGNIVDKVILGSLEYGAQALKCRVLVVMGHTGCTAIREAIIGHDNPYANPDSWRSLNTKDLIERLQPAVDAVTNKDLTEDQRLEAVVKMNVLNTMRTIREQSPVLWNLEKDDMLKIVGAVYHLDTGKVEWLDQ